MSLNLTLIANHSLNFIKPESQSQSIIDQLNKIELDQQFIYDFQKNGL